MVLPLEELDANMSHRHRRNDFARDQSKLLEGFPQTSQFIASDPAKTTVIFRRFDELAVRNLLYLEARLAALEELQVAYDRDDAEFNKDNEPITTAARSWEDFAVMGTKSEEFPDSTLSHWRIRRAMEVEQYKKLAIQRDKPISSQWTTIRELTSSADKQEDVAREEEGEEAGSTMYKLEKAAAAEARLFYDNPLGCGPSSLSLIRSRWELAKAIETSLKEYRRFKGYWIRFLS